MLSSPRTPSTPPKKRITRSSVELSPLSWAQYLAASPPTSSTNSETEVQRMRRMQRLFRMWRDEQIYRARSRRPQRSVSLQPVTSQQSSAVTPSIQTTATIAPTLEGAPRRTPTLSLCDLRGLLDTPWGPRWSFANLHAGGGAGRRERCYPIGTYPRVPCR